MSDDTMQPDERLPEGWTSGVVYDDRYLLIRSAPPKGYMATIDWERRCARVGLVTRGQAISDKKYEGRGWRQALVADAVEHLRSIP